MLSSRIWTLTHSRSKMLLRDRCQVVKPPSKKARADNGASTRVQIKNPVTDRWVKLDTRTGRIVDTKKSPGPFKNISKMK